MAANLVVAQVLLTLVIGLWLGAKFRDSEIIAFFGRNDWFVGAFLIIVGYMNYISYSVDYVKGLNLILIIVGFMLILFSAFDAYKRK